jgi:cytochrome oxidase Cu insertion factor (SCO1/SenC/PrrC family)
MQRVKRAFVLSVLSLAFLLATHGFSSALEVGQPAPDFELDSSKGGKLKLSSLKGKNVLINFYVLDFSPT